MLVTGATGSGKTTTLAAMINHINSTRRQHIVTIEDPIEILHPDRACIVNQREVGLDTQSFGAGPSQRAPPGPGRDPDRRASRRGDGRDRAAGGRVRPPRLLDDAHDRRRRDARPHDRVLPGNKQPQIRSILAGVLRGVVSQRLLPRVDGGRVARFEVMVTNARIAELIRENRSEDISEAIAEGCVLPHADVPAGVDRPRPPR